MIMIMIKTCLPPIVGSLFSTIHRNLQMIMWIQPHNNFSTVKCILRCFFKVLNLHGIQNNVLHDQSQPANDNLHSSNQSLDECILRRFFKVIDTESKIHCNQHSTNHFWRKKNYVRCFFLTVICMECKIKFPTILYNWLACISNFKICIQPFHQVYFLT